MKNLLSKSLFISILSAILLIACSRILTSCASVSKNLSTSQSSYDSSYMAQLENNLKEERARRQHLENELREQQFASVTFNDRPCPPTVIIDSNCNKDSMAKVVEEQRKIIESKSNEVEILADGTIKAKGDLKYANYSRDKLAKRIFAILDSISYLKNNKANNSVSVKTETKTLEKQVVKWRIPWLLFALCFIAGCIFWHYLGGKIRRILKISAAPFLLIVMLAGCQKSTEHRGANPVHDDFGITRYNNQTRNLIMSRKRPKDTPIPFPPPPVANAPAVLFLDFDGHTVTGTPWNYISEIVCSDAGLTWEEQDDIRDSVAFDYSPFNVYVTTDSAVFNSAQTGVRVVVTESWQWYGRAGGVAFINSFDWGKTTPCFVFSLLLGYDVKRIQEACSHEIGHTLGLYHQSVYNESCVKMAEYRPGAIMGNSFYQNGVWWVGTSSRSCYDIQDDVAVIVSKVGLR